MQRPLITGGGKVVRTYRWKRHRAVLVQDPDSFGPIKYRYVLIVFEEPGDNAVMFVTAERNEMQAEFAEVAREALNDPSFQHDESTFVLGVFDQDGRRNLGGSPKWGELVEFERGALDVVRTALAIEESVETPPVRNPERKEPKVEPSEVEHVARPAESETSLLHQLAALFASLVIFFAVWIAAGLLLTLLDHFRGIGDSWLQATFRDVVAPWLGGYAGVAAGLSWLSRSSPKFVFLSFSAVILILIGVYLGVVGPVRSQVDISAASFIWGALTMAAGIFGAYKAAQDNGLRL